MYKSLSCISRTLKFSSKIGAKFFWYKISVAVFFSITYHFQFKLSVIKKSVSFLDC